MQSAVGNKHHLRPGLGEAVYIEPPTLPPDCFDMLALSDDVKLLVIVEHVRPFVLPLCKTYGVVTWNVL